MKRKAVKIRSNNKGDRVICIDKENYQKILKYISKDNRHQKKFRHITDLILNNIRNTELYDKEEINEKCKGVTAMKFFKGQENDRIYCKEIRKNNKVFIVVAAELLEKKKTMKLSEREKNMINKVGGYDYEIEE